MKLLVTLGATDINNTLLSVETAIVNIDHNISLSDWAEDGFQFLKNLSWQYLVAKWREQGKGPYRMFDPNGPVTVLAISQLDIHNCACQASKIPGSVSGMLESMNSSAFK